MNIYIIGIIIAVLILLFSFVFFKRFFSGLISDYLFDAIFSFSDNFLAGAGVVGFDIGDWIGAVIIFFRERKITGTGPAILVAWEATNFIPISFIPVIGEVVEISTGFFPAATVSRVFFSKFSKAESSIDKLKKDIETAKRFGFRTEDKKIFDKINNLINTNPLKVISLVKKKNIEVSQFLIDYYNQLFQSSTKIIQEYYYKVNNQSLSQDLTAEIYKEIQKANNLITESKNFFNNKDYEKAIALILSAEEIIIKSSNEFNEKNN